ncbi:MAG: hypothetical protein KIT18_01345, partial [Burkholderiales bacterium]|nr:hypothetical protein [Burkholderiales bacterium]
MTGPAENVRGCDSLLFREVAMSRFFAFILVCGVLAALPPPAFPASADAREAEADLVRIEQVEVGMTLLGPAVLLKARNR